MNLKFCVRILSKKKKQFQRLVGVSYKEFFDIINKTRPFWDAFCASKKTRGRPYDIGDGQLEDQILVAMIYYKFYTTHFVIGCLFGVHDTAITRCLQRIEPLLAKAVTIEKHKKSSQVVLESIIIDCTEQAIERPKRKQRTYYSGKKKTTYNKN